MKSHVCLTVPTTKLAPSKCSLIIIIIVHKLQIGLSMYDYRKRFYYIYSTPATLRDSNPAHPHPDP